jgi:hypothetical protein
MLSEVVETRKPSGAVTLKGTFTSVFTNVSCQVLTSCEAQIARRKVGAEEALSLLLLGRSVRVASHAFVVRPVLVVFVTVAHVYILTVGC